MKPTLNEKFLAYLALLSGIALSVVAEYYSILGLTAIFAAAVLPVIIMGIALGIGKVSATLWLKQNWNLAPWSIRIYLSAAIVVLMMVTSMGTFGFLSKAHSDQSLVSGDVLAKISVYDEKIKTSKDNIDANRKALKQMDEAVDQVMARSDSEKGADKAVTIRKGQAKERVRLQAEIAAEQKAIAGLNEERAPIAAEVRKVEAEVGPIKYIAAFVYGNTDPSILEKAVTWVIILIIIVFDPLAVILLLSSQISFQNFRERSKGGVLIDSSGTIIGLRKAEGDSPRGTNEVIDRKPPTVTTTPGIIAQEVTKLHPELVVETTPEEVDPILCNKCDTELVDAPGIGLYCPNKECDVSDGWALEEDDTEDEEDNRIEQVRKVARTYIDKPEVLSGIIEEPSGYVQNEEQSESGVWTKTITQAEYAEIGEQRRRENIVNQWVDRVKNKEVSMHHVPVDIVQEVKAKL